MSEVVEDLKFAVEYVYTYCTDHNHFPEDELLVRSSSMHSLLYIRPAIKCTRNEVVYDVNCVHSSTFSTLF